MNQGNFEAPERVEKSIDSVGDSVILHAEWRRTPLLPYSTGWRERRGRERFIASRPLVFPLFLSHFLPPSHERVMTSREIPRFFLDAEFFFSPSISIFIPLFRAKNSSSLFRAGGGGIGRISTIDPRSVGVKNRRVSVDAWISVD